VIAGAVENEHIHDLVKEIISSSERLNRVVENMLDMTRLTSGVLSLKKEWHDVGDLVEITLKKLGHYLDGHEVVKEIDGRIGLAEFDFRLMEHMLSNLVFNSVTYTPPGTQIRIKANADHGRLRMSVEDHGPGVPEADLERIFEKFYRAPGTPTGGTGLGLAIAKNIVELHGGSILAENISPKGLRISFDLPLKRAPELDQGDG
jgi:two-component system sensor histidine kinase KdpD